MNTSRILTQEQARRASAERFRQRAIDRALKRLLQIATTKPADAPDERPSP
jgi:hypothetical protein